MNAAQFNDQIRAIVNEGLKGRQLSFAEVIGILDIAKQDVLTLLKAVEIAEVQKKMASQIVPASSIPSGLKK